MAQEGWNCDTAEGSGRQPQEGLVLCSNNCGCFVGAATMNLCSNCYGELLAKKQGNLSEISTISSSTSPALLSVAASEKPFANCAFSLSLPATAEPIQPQVSLTSAIAAIDASSGIITEFSIPSGSQPSTNQHLMADLAPISTQPSSESIHGDSIQPPVRRHPTNRCLLCKKRMGLLAFKCRCGNVFCASHRYSDKHGCPFDYKLAGREAIAKANPMVIAKKVVKI